MNLISLEVLDNNLKNISLLPKNIIIMTYTAIYSTSDLRGVRYSFTALDVDSAIAFCQMKFVCFPNLVIIENDDSDDDLAGRMVFFLGVKLV